MLKVVDLDKYKDKEIIDYIENFKDERGFSNDGEAIKKLLHIGLANLNNPINNQPNVNIDVESIKNDIIKQLTSQVNMLNLQTQMAQTQIMQQPKPQPYIEQKVEQPKPKPKTKPKPKKEGSQSAKSALMANLLSNASR